MSEIPAEAQALRNRVDRLQPAILEVIKSGALNDADIENLKKQASDATKSSSALTEETRGEVEAQVKALEMEVARIEARAFPTLSQEQQEKAITASRWMFWLSSAVWLILILTNALSIIYSPERYQWPFGWFSSFHFIGFAMAGVAIHILLTLRPRIMRGDWDERYVGIIAFRALQATVYSAVIFHFVRSLDKAAREAFPFAVTGIFVGMFVHLLEGSFAGIGERFVDMISSLFASTFAGPRQKAEQNQELRQKLELLRGQYAGMDKSGLGVTQREGIKRTFDDALLLLQSGENERAASTIQQLQLALADAAEPALELTSVEPNTGFQGEEVKDVALHGQGFQAGAKVRLQKDHELVDATDLAVVSETQIRCTLPLKDTAPGKYDLIVTNANLKEHSLSGGFEVKQPEAEPEPKPEPEAEPLPKPEPKPEPEAEPLPEPRSEP